MKQTPIFIISLKKSNRVNHLKKRLKDIKLNYKIFYGINGNNLNKKELKFIYSKTKTKKNIDRELSPSEIGAAASHLKIYNYIIKKKITQAIIMEDDAYPSALLKKWIKNNITVKNNEILSFYSYPSSSFLKKKYHRRVLKKISIHRSLTHTYNNSCYQINNFTCKRIIKLTKNKVIGLPDWPFLINKENIYLSVTLPFMAIIDDKGISNLKLEREKILNKNKLLKIILPENILSILRIPYYLSYLGFFLKFKNKDFYYEHFFQKQLLRFKNFFFRNYIDINKIYYIKKYYVSDLRKFVKKK